MNYHRDLLEGNFQMEHYDWSHKSVNQNNGTSSPTESNPMTYSSNRSNLVPTAPSNGNDLMNPIWPFCQQTVHMNISPQCYRQEQQQKNQDQQVLPDISSTSCATGVDDFEDPDAYDPIPFSLSLEQKRTEPLSYVSADEDEPLYIDYADAQESDVPNLVPPSHKGAYEAFYSAGNITVLPSSSSGGNDKCPVGSEGSLTDSQMDTTQLDQSTVTNSNAIKTVDDTSKSSMAAAAPRSVDELTGVTRWVYNFENFPMKLYRMLAVLEDFGYSEIVSWNVHGRSFKVHDTEQFVKYILPNFFRQTKVTSFQRQLNIYGFRRILNGDEVGSYYHSLFLRGKPFLCKAIFRTKVKGKSCKRKAAEILGAEPEFCKMQYLPPLDAAQRNLRLQCFFNTKADWIRLFEYLSKAVVRGKLLHAKDEQKKECTESWCDSTNVQKKRKLVQNDEGTCNEYLSPEPKVGRVEHYNLMPRMEPSETTLDQPKSFIETDDEIEFQQSFTGCRNDSHGNNGHFDGKGLEPTPMHIIQQHEEENMRAIFLDHDFKVFFDNLLRCNTL